MVVLGLLGSRLDGARKGVGSGGRLLGLRSGGGRRRNGRPGQTLQLEVVLMSRYARRYHRNLEVARYSGGMDYEIVSLASQARRATCRYPRPESDSAPSRAHADASAYIHSRGKHTLS
jgi:hypothetical protein